MESQLYLIPTPIGNLEDMTFRAIETLKKVDFILSEDTRNSGKLLKHFDIKTPQRSYHMFNEHKITDELITKLKAGSKIALISDAGTPGISDPSYLLVKACIENNIEIECYPGATAFVPALVCSGLPTNEFSFFGFLPPKKGRKTKIAEVMQEEKTSLVYESPHRIVKLITELHAIDPNRNVCLSREISKLFEEHIRGTLAEVKVKIEATPPKGEIVLVIGKRQDAEI